MPILRSTVTSLLAAFAAGLAYAQAPGADAPKPDSGRALERCEAAVTETLAKLRGRRAQDVQFTPGQRTVTPGDDGEVAVKGAGRYSGDRSGGTRFGYSCSYSTKTGLASGVVLREDNARAQAEWVPDLSRVSPEACESAAARLLKEKHPRVAEIAMEPDTRKLQPGPNDHLLLLGQGAVRRAPGMNAIPFNYSCEFDQRNGRLIDVKTSV